MDDSSVPELTSIVYLKTKSIGKIFWNQAVCMRFGVYNPIPTST